MDIHATIVCERDSHKGMIIGKQGRIAKAIRTVVRAAANKAGMKAAVEID